MPAKSVDADRERGAPTFDGGADVVLPLRPGDRLWRTLPGSEGGRTVGRKRVGELPGLVKPALCQPGRPHGGGGHASGDGGQSGDHVVGSNRRADLPDDQVKYHTGA